MGIIKKEKKDAEPQYYLSATNIPTYNYRVYYMKPMEKILYFLLAFIVAAAVAYLFYGGIGKDEFGHSTTITWVLDLLIPVSAGLVAGKLFLPRRAKAIMKKKQSELSRQFRDMLDALNTSIGAGKNVTDSFIGVYEDLKMQYEGDAFILKELEVIIASIQNNVPIEDALQDFGNRSDSDDIKSFASVFKISYRKGGNMKEIIRNTHSILSDKMEIREDIETMATSGKTEQNIMIFMPVALIGIIKMMSPDFAQKFVTPAGLAATTVAVVMFVVAYLVGKAILDIKM